MAPPNVVPRLVLHIDFIESSRQPLDYIPLLARVYEWSGTATVKTQTTLGVTEWKRNININIECTKDRTIGTLAPLFGMCEPYYTQDKEVEVSAVYEYSTGTRHRKPRQLKLNFTFITLPSELAGRIHERAVSIENLPIYKRLLK